MLPSNLASWFPPLSLKTKSASVTLSAAVVVTPANVIAPVALNVPATSKVVPGELVAIPTRSVLASTLNKLASVTPEKVASLLAPAALKVRSPPLSVTFSCCF